MTEEEFKAQLTLSDARLDIANGVKITPERYRAILADIMSGRESRARALAEAAGERARAKRTPKPKAQPLDPSLFFTQELEAQQ